MSAVDRRTLLKRLGAIAAAPLVPACQTQTAAPDPNVPALTFEALRERIDRVVVVMMENRSFDHALGSLSMLEGRSDVDGLAPEMSNPRVDGSPVHPFVATIDCIADPPHSWSACHAQFNEGNNDQFVTEFERRRPDVGDHVMGFLDRIWQPVTYAMADHGVVCDQWFCSLMTGTWPNRFYSYCGDNGGIRGNDAPDEAIPSVFTRMTQAGLTWGGYFSNAPFLALVDDKGPDPRPLEPLSRFFDDADDGDLPHLTIVEPAYGVNDDHPPTHPLAGQLFIGQVLDALQQGPQWERTVVIVTYDEHGGFFDHVPPPTAADDRATEGFDQLGFRVPTLVAGPWVRPGQTSSVIYDHTSIIAFCRELFGLQPLTTRSLAANPMLDCFDAEAVFHGTPNGRVPIPTIVADEEELYRDDCGYTPTLRHAAMDMGQPELQAVVAGTELDRRAQTGEMLARLHARAQRRGLWHRRT